MTELSVFEQLCELLARSDATFRVLTHEAEGRSDAVAKLRGTSPEQAAKAMFCASKEAVPKLVLAVLPGNQKLDFKKLAQAAGVKKITLAAPALATEITRCEMGAVPPFVFRDDVSLIVDSGLLARNEKIAFNAGSLSHSIVLRIEDYLRVVNPQQADLTVDPVAV